MRHEDALLFSVVIPTYNRIDRLPRAIQSILNQTHQNFELIVVDDGSSDETRSFVNNIQDHRIRYVYQENQGVSAARNTGICRATSSLVTFLDSDDEASPEWLAAFATGFCDDRVGVVCVGCTIEQDGNKVSVRLPDNMGAVFESMHGLFLSGTYAVRRGLLEKVGSFTHGLAFSENSDLALRLTANCIDEGWRIYCIDQPLVIYHRQPGRWLENESRIRQRLESAEFFLEVHGERYFQLYAQGYADYCAIAGVCCMRLGRNALGRRYISMAIRANPTNWRHYVRLLMASVPRMGMRYWKRNL